MSIRFGRLPRNYSSTTNACVRLEKRSGAKSSLTKSQERYLLNFSKPFLTDSHVERFFNVI